MKTGKIDVFNGTLMNDAVFKFKRYEVSSLYYTEIATYEDIFQIGDYSTVLEKEEREEL